jgi:hypothetical protein
MNKNINFKSAALGFATAAVAVGTMLGAGVTPAHAGPMLCSPSPKPAFSVDDGSDYEVNGIASVTVRLSRPACTSVKVHLATEDDIPLSAVQGNDYTPTSVDVVIPAKTTSANVSIPLTPDPDAENTETFRVRLTNPVGGSILDAVGIVSILDGPVQPG